MKYKVRYTDYTGSDEVLEYNTKTEAENAIEEGLNICKEKNIDFDYDYGDFGNTTEFWVCDDIEYYSWKRLYE